MNAELGDWDDIQRLGRRFDLGVDLVLNHVSRESLWLTDYLAGSQPGRDYFIEMDPDTDLSAVVRPRSSPLLVKVPTRRGVRHLWATFSEDQIDLNFANPDVLLEFIGILLFYLDQGARVIRLDAIAYLWKQVVTSCIHLPQTHEVVRLLRTIIDHVAPDALLLTETNVPHEESISYFGLDRLAAPGAGMHRVNTIIESIRLIWRPPARGCIPRRGASGLSVSPAAPAAAHPDLWRGRHPGGLATPACPKCPRAAAS
ncbi:alpha-amylase family glycosyl hydrolase [Halomonas almeriensis]|uniref:alpha-amylase family glycosyl hydrolase n=1 Tax=Halomonas almeriensis TaxID=308163 RepID=UPI003F49859B